jgi:ferredoxin
MADQLPADAASVPGGLLVVVDRAVCVGAAQCVLAAPELFEQDDEGLVVLLSKRRLRVGSR